MICASDQGYRFKEGATHEAAQRLKEITVDVKSVTMPKKVDASAGAPKPAVDLSSGTFKYKATIVAGTQSFPLTTTTEIKEDGGAWVATETADTPFGKIVDVSTIEKGSLVLKHRSINQGGNVVELDFKDGKATGTITGKPGSVDVG